MRTRLVKPGFFKDAELAQCSPEARILFLGLSCLADCDGRLRDKPLEIKAEILPHDSIDVEPLLGELHAVALITRYTANGVRVIQVSKNTQQFQKHARPHHGESSENLPAPDGAVHRGRKSFVYFIQAATGGPIKIGSAVDPDGRMRILQTGNPEALVLLGVTKDESLTERATHKMFAASHISGEWFKPSSDLMRFISQHAQPLDVAKESGLIAINPGELRSSSSSSSSTDLRSGVCSERSKAIASEPPESPAVDLGFARKSANKRPLDDAASKFVLVFPCCGPGSTYEQPLDWGLTAGKLEEYKASFPGVDVLAESRKAQQWCRDNPAKRKTPRGMPGFMTRWLTRAQDRGGLPGKGPPPKPPETEQQRKDRLRREREERDRSMPSQAETEAARRRLLEGIGKKID